MNPNALPNRRRIAVRLLLLEATLLVAILGAFALVVEWRVGAGSLALLVVLGAALIAPALGVEWYLVVRNWKRLDAESGGDGPAP
ncbi:MAG TPA: hypothetical protein HA326_00495 [Thermoplasmata archaeon]|nr:hypothetical protein [Thermoplasmata archaeon]